MKPYSFCSRFTVNYNVCKIKDTYTTICKNLDSINIYISEFLKRWRNKHILQILNDV
ncbi:hypothetical protein GLOIN_2v1689071 [Rhizophagus irregularis DAOM 181602=DAOM 197198]|uniref:Uncharacterized protein n=2 Tax=Rhizophagus irregularis TaxID=588596 RepID=A0A2I1GST2_9GLOM|nr:hypothetical protein GLOIN_2v1689071 [Rhizophagus irregularis DAOM 181602=DAOM 197198]PKY49679.1 hypothetical protein RhiirA4_250142 [Rhizophagus irregularis]POG63112.1 hypothetical protein GLOIN_2v1689071 [Rhizophagus irregularis DAOM 181602=DAOM 197198]GET62935.1 hypothetical protein GLOIN_2v1689071 [Rhizophagus irregularis DAOM 181602=DAOM 197198]|eukprot:XP_025169978.1 hypothetical protein GLOIN_2v1689071 [Rhizophagus irregularis DAOM 181602=DAOM 197198]